MSEPTEMHKFAVRMIWQGWTTIEIVDDIRKKFDLLGDSTENELHIRVGQLREQVKQARELAPAAAAQMARDGFEFGAMVEALAKPYLIPNHEIITVVSRAQAVVKAEQEA